MGVTLLIAVARQDLVIGFGGFIAALLILSGSFIFISSVEIAFAVTVPTSLLMESNAATTWVRCCVAAPAQGGSQPPATPRPETRGMAEGYSQHSHRKLPVLVFTLQNASWQKCFSKDLLMHEKESYSIPSPNGLFVKVNKIKNSWHLLLVLKLKTEAGAALPQPVAVRSHSLNTAISKVLLILLPL